MLDEEKILQDQLKESEKELHEIQKEYYKELKRFEGFKNKYINALNDMSSILIKLKKFH